MFKLINLTKLLNNQNHAWAMKIQPKTEKLNMTSYDRIFILDHEETCLIQFQDVFHEIQVKIFFLQSVMKKCVSWGSMKECFVF